MRKAQEYQQRNKEGMVEVSKKKKKKSLFGSHHMITDLRKIMCVG